MKGPTNQNRRGWLLLAAAVAIAAPACSGSDDDNDELLQDNGVSGGGTAGTGATGATGTGATGTGATGGGTGTGATGTGATGTGATGTGATGTGATGGGGGTGATGGTSGTGGSSGNPMCPTQSDEVTDPLIDDLEDGDDSIPQTDGRIGFWSTLNDSSGGTQWPPIRQGNFVADGPGAGADGSSYAARTYGEGFTGQGGSLPAEALARMKVTLRQIAGEHCPYNAGSYAGIGFYAKSDSGDLDIVFNVATTATMDWEQGGDYRCDPPGATAFCYDHYAVSVSLASDWQHYSFSWGEFSQQGFGTWQGPLEPGLLLELQWEVRGTSATTGFDFSVDDIAFIGG